MNVATANDKAASVKRDLSCKPALLPIMANNIPAVMRDARRWLGWRWEADHEAGKWNKPPVAILLDRRGSSTNPQTWCDFDTALRAAEQSVVDGIGFALGDGFSGVDFDNCRQRDTGSIAPDVEAYIRRLNTYGEISPSGEGVKLILRGQLPKGRRTNGSVEVYDHGRYFTVTGHRLAVCPSELASNDADLAALHRELIEAPQTVNQYRQDSRLDDRELAIAALGGISAARADNYHDWLLVGMALHATDSGLLDAWDNWSRQSEKYAADCCGSKWHSFNGSAVGLGSLIHWAKQDTGWTPPRPSRKASTSRNNDDEEKASTADKLVDLALQRYRIGRTETDEAFAVEIDGPNVALMFRGSRDALRSALSRAYRLEYGKVPNSTALADALTALQGEAYAAEPEQVYLRVAEHEGDIIVDLGDASGKAVAISPGDWRVVDHSPVLFRRTAATGSLPIPKRGGTLDELRDLLNVTSATWPLAIGWQVSAFIPNMPHPILLLGGQQGTGKTTAAKKLVGVIDPSPADLRSHPRDVETWAISAAGSWVVAVDNVSTIPDWWSDSLCKAVTGDGWLRRKLYTDGELAVLSFRRVILLTSIDPGALRGDLGDRVLLVDLEPIKEDKRRAERDIDAEYLAARPRILGALFDLLAKVWRELPTVKVDRLPRMADFARLLAAMDKVMIGDGDDQCDKRSLNIYLGQRGRIAETVIESDQVALAIQALIDAAGQWEGTTGELLKQITPEKPPRDWPRTPQSLGGLLKRLTPALEQSGISVTHPPRSGRRRVLVLAREVPQNPVTLVTPVTEPENEGFSCDEAVTSGDERDQPIDPLVTTETSIFPEENGSYDQSDECDECLQPLSSWADFGAERADLANGDDIPF